MQLAAWLLGSCLHQLRQNLEQPQPARKAKLAPVRETDPTRRRIDRIQPDRDHHTRSMPTIVLRDIGQLTDVETAWRPLIRKTTTGVTWRRDRSDDRCLVTVHGSPWSTVISSPTRKAPT